MSINASMSKTSGENSSWRKKYCDLSGLSPRIGMIRVIRSLIPAIIARIHAHGKAFPIMGLSYRVRGWARFKFRDQAAA